MKDNFPGYPVRPLKDFMTLMTSTNIPGLQTFINAMIALAISIGLLVIFLTMYTTVLERTRDIGVLKSLGASKLLIVRSLLTETAALCLLGIVAGSWIELPGAGWIPDDFPDTLDFDYARMDCAGGTDCAGRSFGGCELSGMGGHAQRRRGITFLRLTRGI